MQSKWTSHTYDYRWKRSSVHLEMYKLCLFARACVWASLSEDDVPNIGLCSFFISSLRQELKMEGRKGERGIKEQEITQTPAGVKRAKGGGGDRRPRRETGVVSLPVRESHVSCNKLLTTATLWVLQLVCGSYPLTPYLINSKSFSFGSNLCLRRIWLWVLNSESHSFPWTDVLHPDASTHLCVDTGNSSLYWRKSSLVSANSLLPRIYRPWWWGDALWSPWTHRGDTECIAHHDTQFQS